MRRDRKKEMLSDVVSQISCVTCHEARVPDETAYFRECGHFFCSFCLGSNQFCPKCSHLGAVIPLKDEKKTASIYEILLNLPNKQYTVSEEVLRSMTQTEAASEVSDNVSATGSTRYNPATVPEQYSNGSTFSVADDRPTLQRTETNHPNSSTGIVNGDATEEGQMEQNTDRTFTEISEDEESRLSASSSPIFLCATKRTFTPKNISSSPVFLNSFGSSLTNGETRRDSFIKMTPGCSKNNTGMEYQNNIGHSSNRSPVDMRPRPTDNGHSSNSVIFDNPLSNGVVETPPLENMTYSDANETPEKSHPESVNNTKVRAVPSVESSENTERVVHEKHNDKGPQLPSEYFSSIKEGFRKVFVGDIWYTVDPGMLQRRSLRGRSTVQIKEPELPPKRETPRRTDSATARKRPSGESSSKKSPSRSPGRLSGTKRRAPSQQSARKRASGEPVSKKRPLSRSLYPDSPKKRSSRGTIPTNKVSDRPSAPTPRKTDTRPRLPVAPSRTPPIKRKNTKGETPLHMAVKRSNLATVKDLLDAGADPNEQDYAGWTPLHDAVHAEVIPIVACLLQQGSNPNIPGLCNKTPLHIAVELKHKLIIKLLLEYGANSGAKDIYGDTPRTLAEDTDLVSLLLSVVPKKAPPVPVCDAITVYCVLKFSHVDAAEAERFEDFIESFNCKWEKRDIFNATHVIVSKSWDYDSFDWSLARVMAKGSIIVSSKWFEDSLSEGKLKNTLEYQIEPDWLPGLKRAQTNARWRLPGLFSGCQMVVHGGWVRSFRTSHGSVDLSELRTFLRKAGAELQGRVPDPESVFRPNTVPYHACPGPMERCSQIVVYLPRVAEVPVKYNMEHLKCLPIEWLVDCIVNFELISDTNRYFL